MREIDELDYSTAHKGMFQLDDVLLLYKQNYPNSEKNLLLQIFCSHQRSQKLKTQLVSN